MFKIKVANKLQKYRLFDYIGFHFQNNKLVRPISKSYINQQQSFSHL